MSEENQALISAYKEVIDIVKCQKGGVGLNESYKAICKVLQAKENNKSREAYKQFVFKQQSILKR